MKRGQTEEKKRLGNEDDMGREREREKETQTYRQTDRQTNRQTDRQTDRKTNSAHLRVIWFYSVSDEDDSAFGF